MSIWNPLIIFFILGCMPSIAFAYIDPGSSLLLIQGILAALGALLIFLRNPIVGVRRIISKIKGWFNA